MAIIYNVTVKVDLSIAGDWLHWLKGEHVNEILSSQCFTSATVLRLLDMEDTDGPTYAIQYFAKSRADYDEYMDKFADAMRQKSFEKWGGKFIAFRSVMEVVN